MWYLIYNILLILASPVILIILLAKKRCRRGLLQRLGIVLPELAESRNKNGVIWIHAVSLGEVVAIVPFVQALYQRHPEFQIVVSTVTETGREAVEQRLAGVAVHCYAPLDFQWAIQRTMKALRPAVFLFVETELWPNLLRALSRQNIPAILINGRLSTSSFRGYSALRFFFAKVLRDVTLCLAQSQRDVERFVSLGVDPTRVIRTGNLKFDQLPTNVVTAGSLNRSELGLAEHETLLVAGSTHPGEEEQLLACYNELQSVSGSLVLLMAPRHIERAPTLEATVKQHGWPVIVRSRGPNQQAIHGPRVIILDTRGELAAIYRHGAVGFVGGTFVPVGGHNVLEPAVWARPVFFGPYTDHCEELADLLLASGGAVRVQNGQELAKELVRLLQDRPALQAIGDSARRFVLENRGAVERTLSLLEPMILTRSPVRPARAVQPISHQVVR